MTPEERSLIANLFSRLKSVDAGAKDAEAEDAIRRAVAEQPSAPYLLTQTVLVQEQALTAAQERIGQLERELAAAKSAQGATGGSFLGGRTIPGPWGARADVPPRGEPARSPWGNQGGYARPDAPPPYAQPQYAPQQMQAPEPAGGGFLRSALTTAAGVAGGALLFQGISGLLHHNSGAFGPALASSPQFGGGTPQVTEVHETVNNYYGSDARDTGISDRDYGSTDLGGHDRGGHGFQDASYEQDYTDSDAGGDYDGGTDI